MLMGFGWQFGAVFSLLAVPAIIAASGVYLMTRRRQAGEPSAVEAGAAIVAE
jgi:AAHS family 4-hydroxybenzoate transporter-like MFS transporter